MMTCNYLSYDLDEVRKRVGVVHERVGPKPAKVRARVDRVASGAQIWSHVEPVLDPSHCEGERSACRQQKH